MKESIVTIITAVFNIAAIVCRTAGLAAVSEVLYEIAPEVNMIAIAVLYFFGYQTRAKLKTGI